MKAAKALLTIILLSLIIFVTGCQNMVQDEISGKLPTNNKRIWIGPEYWANPYKIGS